MEGPDRRSDAPSPIALPTPAIDLMFCIVCVLILALSLVFKNRPATEATASAVLLPRAPAGVSGLGGKARVQISAAVGASGQVTFRIGDVAVGTIMEVRNRLERLAPAAVVISVDTRTPPDPLTVTLRLLNVARTLGIPAHLSYKPEAGEGGLR